MVPQCKNATMLTVHRCDLGIVLHCGSDPLFFNNHTHKTIFWPYPDLTALLKLARSATSTSPQQLNTLTGNTGDELSDAWNALSEFCWVTNYAIKSSQYISMDTYLDSMASIMYRLLNMRFESGSSNDAFRLGLLAFSCSVFLQWKTIGLTYTHLASEFRGCLIRLVSPDMPTQLLLWLVMVGAVSVFDVADYAWLEPLLLSKLSDCQITSWERLQQLLNSIMWIGLVHDTAARRMFNSTMASVNGASKECAAMQCAEAELHILAQESLG